MGFLSWWFSLSYRLSHEDVVLCVSVRGHLGTSLLGLLQFEQHLLILIVARPPPLHSGMSVGFKAWSSHACGLLSAY